VDSAVAPAAVTPELKALIILDERELDGLAELDKLDELDEIDEIDELDVLFDDPVTTDFDFFSSAIPA
jgi:hypothetical protein